MMMIGQNVELVNLGKEYVGIPCSVLSLQLANNFEIISKLKVTQKCQEYVSFFFLRETFFFLVMRTIRIYSLSNLFFF